MEGTRVTVQEKAASRALHRLDTIAARVVTPGASGLPELEGLLEIPALYREDVREMLSEERAAFLAEHPAAHLDEFYKLWPPYFHDVWARAILDPMVPTLANTDGEELVTTRVHFEVLDRPAIIAALDASSLERMEGDAWAWTGPNPRGETISLGVARLEADTLVLEVNSVGRGKRGRELLEALGKTSLRHRSTTHEDLQRLVKESLKSGVIPSKAPAQAAPEVQAAMLEYTTKYYREWLELPVPAIDGLTPRQASKEPAMRTRLVELLRGLDAHSLRELQTNGPAFDPSWLWEELGLADERHRTR
jgi:hypothetical protein